MRAELVVDTPRMATWRRRPAPGAIVHADRGAQSTSWIFGHRLREAGCSARWAGSRPAWTTRRSDRSGRLRGASRSTPAIGTPRSSCPRRSSSGSRPGTTPADATPAPATPPRPAPAADDVTPPPLPRHDQHTDRVRGTGPGPVLPRRRHHADPSAGSEPPSRRGGSQPKAASPTESPEGPCVHPRGLGTERGRDPATTGPRPGSAPRPGATESPSPVGGTEEPDDLRDEVAARLRHGIPVRLGARLDPLGDDGLLPAVLQQALGPAGGARARALLRTPSPERAAATVTGATGRRCSTSSTAAGRLGRADQLGRRARGPPGPGPLPRGRARAGRADAGTRGRARTARHPGGLTSGPPGRDRQPRSSGRSS